MESSEVADWRVWKAARVASAPGVTLDGHPVQPGDILYHITKTRGSGGSTLAFITPSPVNLALSISIEAAIDAAKLRASLVPEKSTQGHEWITRQDLASLYAYFERCMTAVTFAYQSLEAFANQIVIENQNGTIRLARKNGPADLTAEEVERTCSTSEKLGTVLPMLGSMKGPKGTKPWENFTKLKKLRDSTTHPKLAEHGHSSTDKGTVYYRFLNHSPKEYPRWAIGMLRYYTPTASDAWLRAAEERLGHK